MYYFLQTFSYSLQDRVPLIEYNGDVVESEYEEFRLRDETLTELLKMIPVRKTVW